MNISASQMSVHLKDRTSSGQESDEMESDVNNGNLGSLKKAVAR